jgi:hypothetical protein
MQRVSESKALRAFLDNLGDRLATLADPSLHQRLPRLYRSAGQIVSSYANGGWKSDLKRSAKGFKVNTARHTVEFNKPDFGQLCAYVCNYLKSLRDTEIVAILGLIGPPELQMRAVMSAFFHYFIAHELLHIEQGLGSDQYADSDLYLPVVMEADYEADICGLVIAAHASIPELDILDLRQRTLLLIAIHIASMHYFTPAVDHELPVEPYSRLVLWYLHYARFAKSRLQPRFADPSHYRSWIVLFPRLIGRSDQVVTASGLSQRHLEPYPAACDIVVAYHGANGLYRIHRAAMTDSDRTLRLCAAVIDGSFDNVREEFEELLISNPTLSSGQIDASRERMERQIISAISTLERVSETKAFGNSEYLEKVAIEVEEVLISIRRGVDTVDVEIRELCALGEDLSHELNASGQLVDGTSELAVRRTTTMLLSIFAQLADLAR